MSPASVHGPIITLTTDFGLNDWYVAALKAVLLNGCPDGRIVDITHLVEAGDVQSGSFVLERAIAAFPPQAVHLAVVDPGVGSSRRILIARVRDQWVVCPDNGLITWTMRRHGPTRTYVLTWRPAHFSHTFHGRDIMAPAAAMLASGHDIGLIATAVDDPVLLDMDLAHRGAQSGRIIYVDAFGNGITNVSAELLHDRPHAHIHIAGRDVGEVRRTYSDVASGQPLALIGSSGLLEISIRDGSAAARLGLHVGDTVQLI